MTQLLSRLVAHSAGAQAEKILSQRAVGGNDIQSAGRRVLPGEREFGRVGHPTPGGVLRNAPIKEHHKEHHKEHYRESGMVPLARHNMTWKASNFRPKMNMSLQFLVVEFTVELGAGTTS
jgi:hypothetical protein